MVKRVRVEFTAVGPGYSFAAGPGLQVDLEMEIAPGLTLAAVTDPDWFEDLAPAAPAVEFTSRGRRAAFKHEPAEPVQE
jgi:hypothetical protein